MTEPLSDYFPMAFIFLMLSTMLFIIISREILDWLAATRPTARSIMNRAMICAPVLTLYALCVHEMLVAIGPITIPPVTINGILHGIYAVRAIVLPLMFIGGILVGDDE